MTDKPKKKQGLTSEEAAALWLSDGATKDPAKAILVDEGVDLNFDDLQRAHLRRMMGFDFRIKMQPNKIHVSSTSSPHVTTHCKVKKGETDTHGNVYSDDLINRLVDACLRLKVKHQTELDRAEKPSGH